MKGRNLKLTLCYDGTPFKGWQKTRMGLSIEGAVQEALQQVLQHPVSLQAASRTDAGVHAEAQVANFFTEREISLKKLLGGVNGCLPREIRATALEEMPEHFHPTLDAIGKEYWYSICYAPVQLPFFRETSWHFPHALDVDAMRLAAASLLGAHDFSSFCNWRKDLREDRICTLTAIDILPLEPGRLRICIQGDRFLYKMMRTLAGTLAYIGCGKLALKVLPEILEKKSRPLAGMTAPAHGLLLKRVFYGKVNGL